MLMRLRSATRTTKIGNAGDGGTAYFFFFTVAAASCHFLRAFGRADDFLCAVAVLSSAPLPTFESSRSTSSGFSVS